MSADGRATVAVAGLGPWGANLARNFNELARLAWVCDPSPERLEAAAARYPAARATSSFDELLADDAVEAVVVATPVPTHAELARRALAAGKHVFVEKPMALGAEDAEALVALAEERGLALLPGHLLLYHPGVLKLKELVDAGELGQVLYVYGNRQNLGTIRQDENALWSLGVHDLSVILFLLDEEPSEVLARGESFLKPGVEDVVFCYLRFPSGKVAHMHLSWLDPHKMRRMTVVGTEKMAVFDDMELDRKVTVYDSAAEPSLAQLRRVEHAHGRRLQPARSPTPSRSGSSASTSSASSGARATASPPPAPGSGSCAPSSSSRPRSSESAFERADRRDRGRLPGHGARRRRRDRRQRGRGQAADARRPLDSTRRGAAPARRRRRHGHPRLRRRLRRQPPREAASSSATRRACGSAASSETASSSAAARSSRTTRPSARARPSRRTRT